MNASLLACLKERATQRLHRLLTAGFLMLLVPGLALAQTAGTGTISGSVINEATQKVLERALVTVAGTTLSTLSDADGSFRINGVPMGPQTLQVSYAGLEEANVAVNVAAGSATTVRRTDR